MRPLLVYIALLVSLITAPVLAGQYQQTKDGGTLVWNDDHKPGDLVSWSGKRDAGGYATGYGTLTWYTPDDRVSSRVSGTMVHGKFGEAPPPTTAQASIEPEKPKKKEWWSIFKPRPKLAPAQIEATPTPKSRPTQVEATPRKPNPATTNAADTPKPTATPRPSTISNSLDSLVHAPSSLKLDSPTASPSPAIPSPTATPDVSLQLAQPPSPSPTP